MEKISVGIIDIIIVLIYVGAIILWALKKGKSADSQSYFLAGRSMPWWIV